MANSVSHSIEVDLTRKLIDLRIGGLISPEDAAWIGEELRAAIRALGDDVGQHVTLYDGSGVPVVPQETVELIKHTLDNPEVRKLWARKIAFVVSTALVGAGMVVGAQIGARLSQRLSGLVLIRLLGVALAFVGARLIQSAH